MLGNQHFYNRTIRKIVVAFGKIVVVFGLSAALYAMECLLLPLKQLDLEYKKKIERRQVLWIVIILGTLLIMFIPPL